VIIIFSREAEDGGSFLVVDFFKFMPSCWTKSGNTYFLFYTPWGI